MRTLAVVFSLTVLIAALPASASAQPGTGNDSVVLYGGGAITRLLENLCSQVGPPAPPSSGEAAASSDKKEGMSVYAGLRMLTFGREISTTHVSGRPRQWATFFQHSQVNQDSTFFAVHRVGGITISGDYNLSEDLSVNASILLGANAATVEHRIGTGNNIAGAGSDYSVTLDTLTGWYPIDMAYGIELAALYSLGGDLKAGVRFSTLIASAPFESAGTVYGIVEGWHTIFANDFDLIGMYKTEYGTARFGAGLSLYEAWSHQEELATTTNQPVDYRFHFRETDWFKIFFGWMVETKEGFYGAIDFAVLAKWSAQMEVGYKFM